MSGRGRRMSLFGIVAGVVMIGAVALIVYPLGNMLVRTFFADGSLNLGAFASVARAGWFGGMVRDTVIVVVCSGLLALAIAAFFAWVNERTDAGLGTLGTILPLVPLLVPNVAVAIGWTLLLSERVGFLSAPLSKLLGGVFPAVNEINIYSWGGLIGLYTMLLVPFAYVIISSALKNVDPALEEASRIAGASPLRTMWKVSLPAIMPAVLGAGLLLLIEGLSFYAVPVIIAPTAGIDILSVRLVRMLTVTFPPNIQEALVLCTLMTATILLLWFVQRLVMAGGAFAKVTARARADTLIRLGPWKWVVRTLLIAYIVVASILPLLALILVSLQPFWTGTNIFANLGFQNYVWLFSGGIGAQALRNSVLIGVVGASIGMLVAATLAIYSARVGPPVSNWIDGVTKLPAAMPHVVIAVGFLITFGVAPFYLTGTLSILILAYIVIGMPQASIAATAAATQIGSDMTEASAIAGARQGRTFRRILLPLMSPGLIAGWGLLFVLMVGELTAASMLSSTRTPVVGFVILDIFEAGSYGQLGALATVVSLLSATVVTGMMYLTLRRTA